MLCTFLPLGDVVLWHTEHSEPESQSTSEHQQLHSKRCKRLADGDSQKSIGHRGQESVEWDGRSSQGDDATQLDFTEPR